jgi:hypothetical protein
VFDLIQATKYFKSVGVWQLLARKVLNRLRSDPGFLDEFPHAIAVPKPRLRLGQIAECCNQQELSLNKAV